MSKRAIARLGSYVGLMLIFGVIVGVISALVIGGFLMILTWSWLTLLGVVLCVIAGGMFTFMVSAFGDA